MRCEICNTITTGGAVSGVCDDCDSIINVIATTEERPVREYSVIPSPTDRYGRVVLSNNGYASRNEL